jgi:hypothetical protein
MNGKKAYFPNKWARVKAIPDSKFEPWPYEDFMDWKVSGWMLPENVECVIRATNLKNHKVKEHVYKRISAANNKIRDYLIARTHELVICYDDTLCHVHPKDLEDYELDFNDF